MVDGTAPTPSRQKQSVGRQGDWRGRHNERAAVVTRVVTQHYTMLQRNLLYTGQTRGKQLVVLIGQKKAVGIAVWGKSRSAYIDKHTSDLGAMLILHDHRATVPFRVLTKGFYDVGRVGHGLCDT